MAVKQNTLYSLNGNSQIQGAYDTSNIDSRLIRAAATTPYALGGGKFAPSNFASLDASGISDGKLILGSTGSISFTGSLAPAVVDGLFTVASPTSTTATIYWDGTNGSRVIILRASDGTNYTVPGNNMGVTGLTQLLVYKAYAYWSPFNKCGIGWAQGTVGVPLIAFDPTATATQLNQGIASQTQAGREPVGALQWTQPAAGNSTPAGPPADPPAPDPGSCVLLGTDIQYLGNPQSSDVATENMRQTDWIFLQTHYGRNLSCTPNHPLYHPDKGKTTADKFKTGDWIVTSSGEDRLTDVHPYLRGCTKVKVMMRYGHLFWANGFLSSNIKINQL